LGFFAWSWDAFDFHSVTLSYPDFPATFHKTEQQMTLAVTFALMTRPLGGIIFGGLADRYGRKWPFVADCCLLIVLVLATGFCQTYGEFLAVRALFGVAMGGIYGNAAATALEDCPEAARGLLSGMYQAGWPFGYILASAFYRAFKNHTRYGWRPLFWFGAGPPILLIIFRLCLAETEAFQSRGRLRNQRQNIKVATSEVSLAIKHYWLLLVYLSFLLAGMVYVVSNFPLLKATAHS
jgi:SHS family lactate transporter-like MFS transporter